MNSASTAIASQPLVSIVMNCYNGERYLTEAIDSVYAQTYANWEIVFWDNGSTDRSAAIAQSYDGRLKYLRASETTPLGAARHLALLQASGTYIGILDTDDVLLPGALERLVAAMEQGDAALCYAGIQQIDQDGREIGRYVPAKGDGMFLDRLLRHFDIWLSSVLVRKAALTGSGLSFDPSIVASEEYCLFMQLAVDHPYRALPEVLSRYRVHDGALTNRSIDKWADEREYTLSRIVERHPGIETRHRAAFAQARARADYYRAKWYLFNGQKRKALHELRRNVFVSPVYAALFGLLLLPTPIWNRVHAWRYGRARFG